MNDYLGTSHEAIYEMVQAGEPGQSQTWAGKISGVSRDLGSQLASLREQCGLISSVWSDGVGSVRLTADLVAVIDYLQVLADGLSGQSASYADITVQAAADLAAAQPPSALPPPPLRSPAELTAQYRQIDGSSMDPEVKALQTAQVAAQVATNQAAWVKAGETATRLDNEYRTALARLTPPQEPPPIVLDAASAGGAVDPPSSTGSAAATGVSAGVPALRAAPAAALGGWSVDRYLPGASTAGVISAGQPVVGGSSLGQWGPGGTIDPGPIVDSGPVLDSGAVVDSGDTSGTGTGSVGAGFVPAGVTGSGVADWSGGGVISAGLLSGGGSALGSRPGVDPVSLHGGIWDGSADADAAGLGTGGAAADQLAHGSLPGAGPGGTGFDPVTGSAITAGPDRFDAAGIGASGGGWETAASIGGIAALAAGAALLSRGGSGAVTAAGLSGGLGTGGSGAGGPGVGVNGAGWAGGSGIGSSGVGSSGVGGSTVGGPGGSGGGGSGTAGYGPGSQGAVNAAGGTARGMVPGMPGAGSNSLVRGGQIGQTGRGMSGAAAAGTGRPGTAGSGIGGEHGYRVTWLVEDRDLYGRGPSVKSVIEAPPDAE